MLLWTMERLLARGKYPGLPSSPKNPSPLCCKATQILRMAHSLIGFGWCAIVGPPLY
jgi:hypothetical protein